MSAPPPASVRYSGIARDLRRGRPLGRVSRVCAGGRDDPLMEVANSHASKADFAFCWAGMAFGLVIELFSGPNQQDAKPVLRFVDDPLPVQAAKAIKR